jgi:hypothetical protein
VTSGADYPVFDCDFWRPGILIGWRCRAGAAWLGSRSPVLFLARPPIQSLWVRYPELAPAWIVVGAALCRDRTGNRGVNPLLPLKRDSVAWAASIKCPGVCSGHLYFGGTPEPARDASSGDRGARGRHCRGSYLSRTHAVGSALSSDWTCTEWWNPTSGRVRKTFVGEPARRSGSTLAQLNESGSVTRSKSEGKKRSEPERCRGSWFCSWIDRSFGGRRFPHRRQVRRHGNRRPPIASFPLRSAAALRRAERRRFRAGRPTAPWSPVRS